MLLDLKEIIDTVPNHYHATQLASCHMALERPERAEGLLNEVLRINPEHAFLASKRSDVLGLKNDAALRFERQLMRADTWMQDYTSQPYTMKAGVSSKQPQPGWLS